ncbi:MAG TPA: energy-coupling factor transporter ATPase [Ruminococcus sp.]|nr:energy-coupling factor transporter ATPase [Ruminococcus sp.]
MYAIKTENLKYVYSEGTPFEKTAINNINLEIEKGVLAGIIGHTGSGKSTLIQHFNGLMKPSSGKIFIDGQDIWENKENIRQVRFKVGLVFQYPEYQLFEETVYKDIAFGVRNMKLSEKEVKERVYDTAKMLEIPEKLLKRSPFELSGGQKRRVAIAGVMAMRPEILILDEPTASLDPHGRDRILDIIKEYHRITNSTVMIVSHSMEDIAKYAEKILVMNKSELFCYDTVKNVFRRSAEIEKMGLDVPQITKVFNRLKELGIPVDDEIYTTEYAKDVVLRLLRERGI